MAQILKLAHVPAKATCSNISTILDSIEVYDKRADKAHERGDFSRANEYANFVMELDALVSTYRGKLPERKW